ncbi:MAG: hypothetical protein WBE76_30610 [Terracidiphilus sp.]
MRGFALLVLAAAISLQPAPTSSAYAQAPANCDSRALMEDALKILKDLVPGTPRSRVEQDFRPDGGLQSFHNSSRYVFKKCPLIKVDIEFTHFDGQQDDLKSDQIIKISRPYLEYPFSD